MSNLKVCRICLRAQCKVYKYDRYQLKSYYEDVMVQKMNEKDGLPLYFCYECATILHNFHKFKEKCLMGQKLLKQLQDSAQGSITYEGVHKIDRALYDLKSSLNILIVSERVRNYTAEEQTAHVKIKPHSEKFEDEKEINMTDMEKEEVFFDEVTTYEDKNDTDSNVDTQNDTVEASDHESENIDKMSKIDNDSEPESPQAIFVDAKKDAVVLKSEPIKRRRKSFSEYGLKKSNPKFAKVKVNHLDKSNWTIYTLSEEEAVKEFQSKADIRSYKNAAYKCVDCFKGFSKEDMLTRHKQLRHIESLGNLECRFCHKRFKWESKLRKHMVEHFTRYKCLNCGLNVSTENSAMLHTEYHKGALKKCEHCGEEFRHRSTYYTHLRTHRSKYLCNLCGMSFVSPSGLHMHRKIKHLDDQINDADEDDEPVNTFCEKCDIKFETRKAFEEHLFHSAMHVEGTDDEQDNSGVPKKVLSKKTKAEITKSLNRNNGDEKIPIKPKKGRRPRLRRCHKKPTSCNQCGKNFDTQTACLRHHLAEHPRTSFFNERHICEVCGVSLALGSVAMHQNIHTRQKEHACDTCGRKFHSTVGLKRHLVTHTGEKPYACTLCDKRFTQSNSMKLHYKTIHLKEPYPRRNRRRRQDEKTELPATENKICQTESDAEFEMGVEPAPCPQENIETIHYLILT